MLSSTRFILLVLYLILFILSVKHLLKHMLVCHVSSGDKTVPEEISGKASPVELNPKKSRNRVFDFLS